MGLNTLSILSGVINGAIGKIDGDKKAATKKKEADDAETAKKKDDPENQESRKNKVQQEIANQQAAWQAVNQAMQPPPNFGPLAAGAAAQQGKGGGGSGGSSGGGSKGGSGGRSTGSSGVPTSSNTGAPVSSGFAALGASIDPKTNEHAAAIDKVMTEAGDKPLLVKFGADWCGPCKQFDKNHGIESGGSRTGIPGATLHDKGDHAVLKVDIDQNPDLAGKIGVDASTIPTLGYVFRKEDGSLAFAQDLKTAKEQHTKKEAVVKEPEPAVESVSDSSFNPLQGTHSVEASPPTPEPEHPEHPGPEPESNSNSKFEEDFKLG